MLWARCVIFSSFEAFSAATARDYGIGVYRIFDIVSSMPCCGQKISSQTFVYRKLASKLAKQTERLKVLNCNSVKRFSARYVLQ